MANLYTPIDPYKKKPGRFAFIYGPTGVGKTLNSFMTLPEPILYMMGEFRDQIPQLKAIKDIENRKVIFYETPMYFDQVNNLIEFLAHEASKSKVEYKSAIFDGWANFMNVSTGGLLEDDFYKSRDEDKIKRPITEKVARDPKLYGSLASYMLRVFQLLRTMSTKFEIPVVVLCLSKQISKYGWARDMAGKLEKQTIPKFMEVLQGLEVEGAFDTYTIPAVDGKQFLFNFPGITDFIGLLEDNRKKGKLIYPPVVKFRRDENYLAKWTGPVKKLVGELDFRKIFK